MTYRSIILALVLVFPLPVAAETCGERFKDELTFIDASIPELSAFGKRLRVYRMKAQLQTDPPRVILETMLADAAVIMPLIDDLISVTEMIQGPGCPDTGRAVREMRESQDAFQANMRELHLVLQPLGEEQDGQGQ